MNIITGYPDRKGNRLKNFDYSQSGYYFVTICSKNMWKYFGDIHHNMMCLNDLGAVVAQQWVWLERQYADVSLDAWCVMPNHFHGILGIGVGDLNNQVGTGRDLSVRFNLNNLAPPQLKKSLSGYIGAFKTTSSKIIRRDFSPEFRWHRSFHDRIIRNNQELGRIRQYIWDNPKAWHRDRNRP